MIRPPEPDDLKAFARRLVRLLEDRHVLYAICGSFATMEYSEPRLSIDVDFMLLVAPDQLPGLVDTIERSGVYVTPVEVILAEMLPRGTPFNIVDGASGSKADIYLVANQGLAGSAMQRRRQRLWDLESGETAWFLAPEDVILFELDHYRMGGEVAEKHPGDIAKMLTVMAADLDTAYIERWARQLGVQDLWQELSQLRFE